MSDKGYSSNTSVFPESSVCGLLINSTACGPRLLSHFFLSAKTEMAFIYVWGMFTGSESDFTWSWDKRQPLASISFDGDTFDRARACAGVCVCLCDDISTERQGKVYQSQTRADGSHHAVKICVFTQQCEEQRYTGGEKETRVIWGYHVMWTLLLKCIWCM